MPRKLTSPNFLLPALCSLLVCLFQLLIGPTDAFAEPHFSLRTGLRCSQCHTSPTGGGKRTAYGNLYAQSNLALGPRRSAMDQPAEHQENGSWVISSLATGEITDWLGMGGDLRLANTSTFIAPRTNSFDITEGTLYLELRPWPERITLYLDQELAASGARNREAWALIRGPWRTYFKAGRIFPPFGLRLLDDATYTRRSTGANFANSDIGGEVGLDAGPIFAAIALTNGSFAASDSDWMKSVWGLVELNTSFFRFGLSGNYSPTDAGCRKMAGAFTGVRLGRMVIQGEVDLIADHILEGQQKIYGLAAMAEGNILLTKGLNLQVGWDFNDSDLEQRYRRRQRLRFGIDAFVLRMLEFKIYYSLKDAETDQPDDQADRLEVILHVFL